MSQASVSVSTPNECKTEEVSAPVFAVPTITSEEREKYRQEEKEKGIRYCDIQQGWCLNVCEQGKTSCNQCLTIMTHFT